MQQKLEKLQHDIEGWDFIYQEAPHLTKKRHKGIEVSLVGDKFKIETDSRTFVIHHTEVESFMKKVTFMGSFSTEEKKVNKPVAKFTEFYVPEACSNLSTGLMAMFEKISSGTATKEDREKAKSMSDIAGKIIDVEKVKLGYLALSKR